MPIRCFAGLWIALVLGAFAASCPAADANRTWYRSPTLAIMTGFIYEPLKPYSIQTWDQGLGSRFDADRWVADFKQAGATYLIFYDKWIDGFVFHDTKTTRYKSHRDLVRPLAEACRRGGLRLVLYFNAVSDGNPEFEKWWLRDRSGAPVVFSPTWPTRYQTLASPFRQVAVEQLREVFTQAGPIDGIWLDIFSERADASNPWMAQAYQKTFGVSAEQDGSRRLGELHLHLLGQYVDEVKQIAAKHQPTCLWTANGSTVPGISFWPWARTVGERFDFTSMEGHQFDAIDQYAALAWVDPKPMETGLLLNQSWFTPLEDTPPPAAMTQRRALASAAIGICQGSSIYLALTPGHAGTFGADLEIAKAIGAWFKTVQPLVEGAEPYADVAVVLGAPARAGTGLPTENALWSRYPARQMNALDQAIDLNRSLAREGVFGRVLYTPGQRGDWPASLANFKAVILPERALLDEPRVDQLRQYVRQGGRLIAFGHASMLGASGERTQQYALADVLGARARGEVAFSEEKPSAVRVDSEYSPQYAGRHLVDEQPTAWASVDTPMPHWAEIRLPRPVEVAEIELTSRSDGAYLVTDFDVEVLDGGQWKLVKTVRGATTPVIAAPLDRPVRTEAIRVTIRRELFEGRERNLADVQAIRVLDTQGRNRAIERVDPVPIVAASPVWQQATQGQAISLLPILAQIEPTTAEILARAKSPTGPPVAVRNRFGRGEAILIATSEAAFQHSPAFWPALRRLTVGEPTLVSPGMDRYRFILTRVGPRHVLHVIDRTEGKAEELKIGLDVSRLGTPTQATLAGSPTPLATTRSGHLLHFTVRPDPVASIVLGP